MICPTGELKYFFKRGWTRFSDLPVGQDGRLISPNGSSEQAKAEAGRYQFSL
jgi:hypothetical protein